MAGATSVASLMGSSAWMERVEKEWAVLSWGVGVERWVSPLMCAMIAEC